MNKRQLQREIEVNQRAGRVLSLLYEAQPPVRYKDIQQELGLSYKQVVEVIRKLKALDMVYVTVIAQWNGRNYIYPHHVWITETPVL